VHHPVRVHRGSISECLASSELFRPLQHHLSHCVNYRTHHTELKKFVSEFKYKIRDLGVVHKSETFRLFYLHKKQAAKPSF